MGGKHTRQCAGTTAEFIVRLVVDSLAVANMCHLAMLMDAGTMAIDQALGFEQNDEAVGYGGYGTGDG